MPPRLVALLAALALFLVACADEPRPLSSPSPSATGAQVEAFLALCSVSADVAAEDLATAEATFHDEVHEALHELADDLEGVDRELSAALLQAKSKVEADLVDDPPDATALATHVAELVEATGAGLAALGVEAPGCPEQVT